jgi:hypothetical protein
MLDRQPEHAPAIRRHYREIFAPAIRVWSVMSANYRTVGIFIFALLKAPEYYFAIEIVIFNVILAFLLSRHRDRYTIFFAGLDSPG